jgi:hypothetical protein
MRAFPKITEDAALNRFQRISGVLQLEGEFQPE